MDDVERFTVELPTDIADELRAAVEAGDYPTTDAAIRAAIDPWLADRLVARIGVERLRRHWDEGLASGDPQPLDFAELMARANRRADVIRAARRRAG